MVERKNKIMTVDDLLDGKDQEDDFLSFTRASNVSMASDRMRNRVNIRGTRAGANSILDKQIDFADLLGEKNSAESSNDPTTTSDELISAGNNRVSTRNLGSAADFMREVQQSNNESLSDEDADEHFSNLPRGKQSARPSLTRSQFMQKSSNSGTVVPTITTTVDVDEVDKRFHTTVLEPPGAKNNFMDELLKTREDQFDINELLRGETTREIAQSANRMATRGQNLPQIPQLSPRRQAITTGPKEMREVEENLKSQPQIIEKATLGSKGSDLPAASKATIETEAWRLQQDKAKIEQKKDTPEQNQLQQDSPQKPVQKPVLAPVRPPTTMPKVQPPVLPPIKPPTTQQPVVKPVAVPMKKEPTLDSASDKTATKPALNPGFQTQLKPAPQQDSKTLVTRALETSLKQGPPTESSQKSPLQVQPQKPMSQLLEEFAFAQQVKPNDKSKEASDQDFKRSETSTAQRTFSVTKPNEAPSKIENRQSIRFSTNMTDQELLNALMEQDDASEEESDKVVGAGKTDDPKTATSIAAQVESDDSDGSNELLDSQSSQADDVQDAIDKTNFLRYASESAAQRLDLLEIVSKNERAFKQAAERLMQQSSQLTTAEEDESSTQAKKMQRRLLLDKYMPDVAKSLHKNPKLARPTCVASLEEYICFGMSDGSVKLFDTLQAEIKHFSDKSVKGNEVKCLDMQRVDKSQNVFIVCGHQKGHLSLFEVKGLAQRTAQNPNAKQQLENIDYKHRKTIDDANKDTVLQVKFFGDFSKEICVISCDIKAQVFMTTFVDSYIMFRATSTKLNLAANIGPTLCLQPLYHNLLKQKGQAVAIDEENESFMDAAERKIKEALKDDEKVSVVCLGTLDQILFCQVKPVANTLLTIKRPLYIKQGTVPYFDWGLALTPTYRDRAYPCLAIAWGNCLQLAVLTNEVASSGGTEEPQLQFDGFYIGDCESIDQIFFLSDSLIFVLVNKREIKVLYTQNFTPGMFDEQLFKSDTSQPSQYGHNNDSEGEARTFYKDLCAKYSGVAFYAEKDSGQRLIEDDISTFEGIPLTSNFYPEWNFNTSICKNHGFNVVCLGNTQVILRSLTHWEEYIDLIRRTNQDITKVLILALDIYNFKKIGLAGLPDQREERQNLMRERMRDLVQHNVNACIKEFKEGNTGSKRSLSRTMEFCIKIGVVDDIFGKLFDIFVSNSAEQMYFESLDPFMLSGRFKHIRLPLQLLQKLLKHYRTRDRQVLEQVLLSIDLSNSAIIYEVRQLCEEEQLSSALIHILNIMLTSEEDLYTSCMGVLISLFNMMVKAKHQKSQREVLGVSTYLEKYPSSLFELSPEDAKASQASDEDFQRDRLSKIEIEHSSSYIGYKMLWLITRFLDGCDYPKGNLDTLRWRYYVVDIVTFVTNEKFMQWFLEFDPECFFTMLRKIFNDPEPYDFVDSLPEFIEANKAEQPLLGKCHGHSQMLTIFDKVVFNVIQKEKAANNDKLTLKAETLQNAFLFFLTQIARNKKIQIPKPVYMKLIQEQINFHKTLLRIPRSELLEALGECQDPKRGKNWNIYNFLVKRNERDLIQVFKQYRDHITSEEIGALLESVNGSPLHMLRVLFMQIQGQYEKCFHLYFENKAIKQDVFSWLADVQSDLQSQKLTTDERHDSHKETFEQIKTLIGKNMVDLVRMDPFKSVALVDYWFNHNYLQIADFLKGNRDIAFSFLDALLTVNEEQMMAEYNQQLLQNRTSISTRYKHVLLRLVELVAEGKVKTTKSLVDLVNKDYIPLEESLKICEKHKQQEACAVLYRRKGKLQKSVELYIRLMATLCSTDVMTIIVHAQHIQFEDPKCTSQPLKEFDRMLKQIIQICAQHSVRMPEQERINLWLHATKSLFDIGRELEMQRLFSVTRERPVHRKSSAQTRAPMRSRVAASFNDVSSGGHGSSSEDEREEHDAHLKFQKFLLIRSQHFIAQMSEYVNLAMMIQFLEQCGYDLKYDDFRQTFEEKIDTDSYFISILESAIRLSYKQVLDLRHDCLIDTASGYKTKRQCDKCGLDLIGKFGSELMQLYCGHTFHQRCVNKESSFPCSVCNNELANYRQLQQLRKPKTPNTNPKAHKDTQDDPDGDDGEAAENADSVGKRFVMQEARKVKKETKENRQQRRMVDFDHDLNKETLSRKDYNLM